MSQEQVKDYGFGPCKHCSEPAIVIYEPYRIPLCIDHLDNAIGGRYRLMNELAQDNGQ